MGNPKKQKYWPDCVYLGSEGQRKSRGSYFQAKHAWEGQIGWRRWISTTSHCTVLAGRQCRWAHYFGWHAVPANVSSSPDWLTEMNRLCQLTFFSLFPHLKEYLKDFYLGITKLLLTSHINPVVRVGGSLHNSHGTSPCTPTLPNEGEDQYSKVSLNKVSQDTSGKDFLSILKESTWPVSNDTTTFNWFTWILCEEIIFPILHKMK